MDFNQSKNDYRTTIEHSIKFSGKDHDFFIGVKAEFLKSVVKKHLPQVETARLLDVGCGHGYIHPRLMEAGLEIVGIDVADEVLDIARNSNPHITYLSHDGKTLPFEEASFDIAMAICVMHHVPPEEWSAFLSEMKRVLRPGGIVIVFEHNPYNPLTRFVVATNILDKGVVLLSSSRLEKLMIQSGLTHPHSRSILFTPFAHPLFRRLDQLLGWCSLGAQYYTFAKKGMN